MQEVTSHAEVPEGACALGRLSGAVEKSQCERGQRTRLRAENLEEVSLLQRVLATWRLGQLRRAQPDLLPTTQSATLADAGREGLVPESKRDLLDRPSASLVSASSL